MLKYDNTGRIILTQGDSAAFEVIVDWPDGSRYVMEDGDYIRMTARKKPQGEIILQVTSTDGIIRLTPDMTHDVTPGSYYYDIELANDNSGEVYTVLGLAEIPRPNFIITYQVTEAKVDVGT